MGLLSELSKAWSYVVKPFDMRDWVDAVSAAIDNGVANSFASVSALNSSVTTSQISGWANGTTVWIETFKRFYRWSTTSTATPDAGATVLNPTANGVNPGRLLYLPGGAFEWAAKTAWFVDGANASGLANNENDGQSATTPIVDGNELQRRLQGFALTNQVTINVLSTSLFGLDLDIVDGGALYFLGSHSNVQSGTCSAATAINRAAPGTKATFTAAGFDFAGMAQRRVRITGGNANARLDERFVIDSAAGGVGVACNITRPLIPAANRFTGSVTPNGGAGTLPVAGDTFDVYDVPTINGYIILRGAPVGPVNQNSTVTNCLVLEDVTVGQLAPNRRMAIQLINPSSFHNFISVQWVRALFAGNGTAGGGQTSCFLTGQLRLADVETDFYGGATFGSGAIQLITPAAQVYPDMDIYFNAASSLVVVSGTAVVRGANVSLGTVGCFQAGHGINVPPGATWANSTNADGTHQLWGTVTGAGNAGVNVQPGGKLYIDSVTPTVTGPGGDSKIANLTTALTQNRGTGAWTGGINTTWANWAANSYLVDPNTSSGIMKNA